MIHQTDFFKAKQVTSDLKRKTIRGGAMTVAAQGCLFMLGMVSTIFLARLLTPSDFGLVAMVVVVTGFISLFKDLGLSAATVQSDTLDHGQISNLFWFNVALSAGITLLLIVIAPAVALFYREPRLEWIMFALSGAFIFSGLTAQHRALLRRQMRFGALAAIDISSRACGIGTAILMAWYGAGYWALVVMHVVMAVIAFIVAWSLSGWRPGWPVRHASIRAMLAFGGNLTGFNLINYFARNVDQMLIGWYWGAQPVGLYNKAYQLLVLPLHQINTPFANVAVSALSRLQNDPERYRLYYCRAMNLIASITTPLTVTMAVLSDEIIAIVLGPQWLGASVIFKILAIAALGQPVASATGWIYQSLGQTRRMMIWAIISTPPLIVAFAVGLPWGAVGVATAYAITDHLRRIPLFLFAFKHSPIKMKNLIDATWRPFLLSLMMWLVMSQVRSILPPSTPAWTIFYCCAAGALTMAIAILSWPRAREEASSVIGFVRFLWPQRRSEDLAKTRSSGLETATSNNE